MAKSNDLINECDESEILALTKKLARDILVAPNEKSLTDAFELMADDITIIGTGRKEVYHNKAEAVPALAEGIRSLNYVKFEMLDEWYDVRKVSEEIYVVFGSFWARQVMQDKVAPIIEMYTRVSVVYKREGKKWKLWHIHQSVPYIEQGDDDFFPISVMRKAEDAMRLAEAFKHKSELDLMTSVFNHESFCTHVSTCIENNNQGALYLFDLDRFKECNDMHGHAVGDILLKIFAKVLCKHFGEESVIGRMGGDEFAVFIPEFETVETMKDKIKNLQTFYLNQVSDESEVTNARFSVGVAQYSDNKIEFKKLFTQADKALYSAKRSNEKFCVYDDSLKDIF